MAPKLGDERSWLVSLEALSDDGDARLGACNAVDQALGTSVQAHGSTQICLDLTVRRGERFCGQIWQNTEELTSRY